MGTLARACAGAEKRMGGALGLGLDLDAEILQALHQERVHSTLRTITCNKKSRQFPIGRCVNGRPTAGVGYLNTQLFNYIRGHLLTEYAPSVELCV